MLELYCPAPAERSAAVNGHWGPHLPSPTCSSAWALELLALPKIFGNFRCKTTSLWLLYSQKENLVNSSLSWGVLLLKLLLFLQPHHSQLSSSGWYYFKVKQPLLGKLKRSLAKFERCIWWYLSLLSGLVSFPIRHPIISTLPKSWNVCLPFQLYLPLVVLWGFNSAGFQRYVISLCLSINF